MNEEILFDQDEKRGNIAFANGRKDVIDAIKQCASLYDMYIVDIESAMSDMSAAEYVAWYQRLRGVIIEELQREE